MQRRLFLAGAGGAMASLPLSAGAAAGPAPGGATDLRILSSYVANRDQFPDAARPDPGERLELHRRPDRAFDPASIAVTGRSGREIGYLPSVPTAMLAALLDEGFQAYALAGRPEPGAADIPVEIYLRRDFTGRGTTA